MPRAGRLLIRQIINLDREAHKAPITVLFPSSSCSFSLGKHLLISSEDEFQCPEDYDATLN